MRRIRMPDRADAMNMGMYMLELMYAPADWLTLMVMPTYMNMDMQSQGLLTPPEQAALPPDVQAMYTHHTSHEHTSGGIGDTGIYALVRALDGGNQRVHADARRHRADRRRRRSSSATRTRSTPASTTTACSSAAAPGTSIRASRIWGGRPRGSGARRRAAIVRMENRNASGYALGDVVQATAGAATRSTLALGHAARVYTRQGAIRGEFNGTFTS